MPAARANKVDAILARFPGPVTLPVRRLKWLAMLAGGLAFAVIAIWMLHAEDVSGSDRWAAWAGLLIGGLIVPFAAIMLLPAAGSLTLDADGFVTCSLFRRFHTPWRQVSEFRVGEYPFPGESRQRTIIYDDTKSASLFAEPVREMLGRNSALPDTYGLSYEDLAQLMTQWRARALAAHGGSRVPHIDRPDMAAGKP